MNRAIVSTLLLLLAGCSGIRDDRLDGTWVSDREATVAYGKALSPSMDWEKYSQIFGHLRITYDAETVVTDFQGSVERRPLHLVRKDTDSVTAKVWDDLDERHRMVTMHFVDSNTYWIYIRDTDHREYFRRVRNAEGGPANGSHSFRSETNSTSSAAGSRR